MILRITQHALLIALTLSLSLVSGTLAEPLTPLAHVGPWSGISSLIGYAGRLWFVNSVKYVNHNSADVYSYDPTSGHVRFEQHLLSQDSKHPAVAGGLLYWPFEGPRASMGRGEYMVTNGRDWQWRVLPRALAFHTHAMVQVGGDLYASFAAWRTGLARSSDRGSNWNILPLYPSPANDVTRLDVLANFLGTVYGGLYTPGRRGANLVRLAQNRFDITPDWPIGTDVDVLHPWRGWLYAVNSADHGSRLWRTNGAAVEAARGLDGHTVRALASSSDRMWAATVENNVDGALWESADGLRWRVVQRFAGAQPVSLAVFAGHAYVGTIGPYAVGTLWGPATPAPTELVGELAALPSMPAKMESTKRELLLARVDEALANPSTYTTNLGALREPLAELGEHGGREAGVALAKRLNATFPKVDANLIGGHVHVPAARFARWALLWAMAQTGGGRVPPAFIALLWKGKLDPIGNPTAKYFETVHMASWAVAQLKQRDRATLSALVTRLGRTNDPDWLEGDLIGALTTLTGEPFGYNLDAWRSWWAQHRDQWPN